MDLLARCMYIRGSMKITHWMTWYRMDFNPNRIHDFVPRTPYNCLAFNLVNKVNGALIQVTNR